MPRNSTRRSKKAQPAESVAAIGETVQVFDPTFTRLVAVEGSAIVHMPPASLHITRLVMCRNYVPHKPDSCSVGAQCKFVHVDVPVDDMRQQTVHVNYAWRSVDLVTYDRLPAGEMLNLLGPNYRPPMDGVPSEMVLVTRGATHRKPGMQLSHCAHYYFNRMCNRGHRCNFIHAVHVDPTVKGNFKRAPPGHRPMEAAGSTSVTDCNTNPLFAPASARATATGSLQRHPQTDENQAPTEYDGGLISIVDVPDAADCLTSEPTHNSPIVLKLATLGDCMARGDRGISSHHELPQAAMSYSSEASSIYTGPAMSANGCGGACTGMQSVSSFSQYWEFSQLGSTSSKKKLKKSASVLPLEDIDPAAVWAPMSLSSAESSLDIFPHGARTPNASLHAVASISTTSQHFTYDPYGSKNVKKDAPPSPFHPQQQV